MSITKQLQTSLGGTWKYDGSTTWWGDHMHVSRCCASLEEDCPEYALCFTHEYWLYFDDLQKVPVRAELFMYPQEKAR